MIAGKQFTTLADIEGMRRLCRAKAKVPVFNSEPPAMTRLRKTGQHREHARQRSKAAPEQMREGFS
jgi:hypothetical protein